MSKEQFQFGTHRLKVWHEKQPIQRLVEPTVWLADFTDTASYHPRLRERILKLGEGSEFRDTIFKGGCGVKVRHPGRWGCIEAELVQARAVAMYKLVYAVERAVIDDAWANIYHHGDYCLPHSHVRSEASVLYLLDAGDGSPPEDPVAGRFCFGDPRMRYCCPDEEGRMTRHLVPDLFPGSMMLFPSECLHHVNPYLGQTPRITMSWNIGRAAKAGRPGILENRPR